MNVATLEFESFEVDVSLKNESPDIRVYCRGNCIECRTVVFGLFSKVVDVLTKHLAKFHLKGYTG